MFTLTIADDTADALFRDILVQDYRGLVSNIAELEDRPALASHEQSDLDDNRRYVAAMEIIMEYYFTETELREAIGA